MPRKRKCRGCKGYFPEDIEGGLFVPLGFFHSKECATQYSLERSKKKHEKDIKKQQREEKKAHNARKRALRNGDLSYQIKKTQRLFNRYIRLRDHDQPCISCGRFDHQIQDHFTGGKWDCGHFRTVGACPELRFEELNAHKQCKQCNRDKAGDQLAQRPRIAERHGMAVLEWLEGPHDAKRYRCEDLIELQDYYREQIKELEANEDSKN